MHLLQLDVELSILELSWFSYKNDRGNTPPANNSLELEICISIAHIYEYKNILQELVHQLWAFMKKTYSM